MCHDAFASQKCPVISLWPLRQSKFPAAWTTCVCRKHSPFTLLFILFLGRNQCPFRFQFSVVLPLSFIFTILNFPFYEQQTSSEDT
jgi:hypothetical protein